MSQQGQRIEARKLKGFRDYTPELAIVRQSLIRSFEEQARRAGFAPIDTPALEYADVLLGSSNGETDKEVYSFQDHGERSVALRFDLTVPFARFVSEHQGTMSFPFKKVQVGEVWRGEKPQKGRYRQFCQADIDIIGVQTIEADVEVITTLARALSDMLPSTFTMVMGHRQILSDLIRQVGGLPQEAEEAKVLIAIDKLAKIGRDKVVALLDDILPHADKLVDLLLLPTESAASLEQIKPHLSPAGTTALAEFQTTLTLIQEALATTSGVCIRPDLSTARGLGYYTGLVFETTVDALPGFGSVCSGGRYDKLVNRFSKQELAGMGGSIGIDRLLAAREELGSFPAPTAPDLFIAIACDEARTDGFALARDARSQGLIAHIGVKRGKLGGLFKQADRLGCRYVVVIGPDELAAGTYTLKALATGDENRGITRAALLETVKSPAKN